MEDLEDIGLDKTRTIVIKLYDWVNTFIGPIETMKSKFHDELARLQRFYKNPCSKIELVEKYRQLIHGDHLDSHDLMWQMLQKKSRNISGITNITVLTSPYPHGQKFSCKHNCYYCPNEPGQPRSYLYEEPAVRRANANGFRAKDQMWDRMETLHLMGAKVDKLEIIIEGGTYTEYPMGYLHEFHRDLFYAANTFWDTEKRDPLSLEEEKTLNTTGPCRIIGICIETRPDAIDDTWIKFFRLSGTTRIQLGVQHVDDQILQKVNRGHTVQDAINAMEYLRNNGFKIDIHIMPDLPGATPEDDIQMFDILYTSPDFCPDQMKIYPCSIVPWSVLQTWKHHIPYAETPGELERVVKYAMDTCPYWMRLPRVIRDIPVGYISGGCKTPNMRQKVGGSSRDIRSREIGRHPECKKDPMVLFRDIYDANGGKEYFISMESPTRKALYGFIRLRIPPSDHEPVFRSITNMGLVRELHVYGQTTMVHEDGYDTQHMGVGTTLLKEAEGVAKGHECKGVAVITGVGVEKYYEKLGYTIQDTYAIKKFCKDTIGNGCSI